MSSPEKKIIDAALSVLPGFGHDGKPLPSSPVKKIIDGIEEVITREAGTKALDESAMGNAEGSGDDDETAIDKPLREEEEMSRARQANEGGEKAVKREAKPRATPSATSTDPSPKGDNPWAVAVTEVVDGWGLRIDNRKRTKLLKNRTLFTPELSSKSKDTSLKNRTEGTSVANFPIRWSGPQTLFEAAAEEEQGETQDSFTERTWNSHVPTWIKLLVRRYTIEDGVLLMQPVDISSELQKRMGIQNVKGYFQPPPKDSKKMKGKFVPKRGNLVKSSAKEVEDGRELEHMVQFAGEGGARAVTGALLELVDPNQWFIDLREVLAAHFFQEIVHEQMLAKDREIDDLRKENKRKQRLGGASEQLKFLVEQDYVTTSGAAKDGLTTSEMKNHIAEYERFEAEIGAAAQTGKGDAKQEQFDYYVEHMWPTIQADFLRDPSEARLNKVKAGSVAGTGGPRGGSQPPPNPAEYAGLLCILPSGALVESTALSVSHFMLHNEDLELALFFQGGKSSLPQPESPLANSVFVKGGCYRQRRGKLVKTTSRDFEKALRQSNGREALVCVQLDEEHAPVDIKGGDLELQRIPKALQALQQLVPGLDDAAIAKSVELYWHETKKKAIMRGQLIEDEMNEV
jgi:hypothetical protein